MSESAAARHTTPPTPERWRATPELCQLIECLIDTAAVPYEATLSDVRNAIVEGIFICDGEVLYPQGRTFLIKID